MRRIFRIKVMMTAVLLLLMAAMPGQRLAAQDAGESVLPEMGNVPDVTDGTQVPGVGPDGGTQEGGVMELTLDGAMDLACGALAPSALIR